MRRAVVALLVVGALGLVLVVGIVVALIETNPKPPRGRVAKEHSTEQDFSQIQRGLYLATVADCAACHTDPHGGKPFAGGRAIETPFGVMHAPNITPDPETGIGDWTERDFANALQRGFGRDGHLIYPAMPFPYYTKVSDTDVRAIFAYMRTVLPVRNEVRADTLPFPFNIRLAMRAWDILFFHEGRYRPDPAKDEHWNHGAYLVAGMEHCGACHTPKNLLGADDAGRLLQGNVIQGWYAPNLTNDARRGLGSWSVDDVVRYLQTGHNEIAGASGPMAEEVSHSSGRMKDGDLRDIAIYLKSLPGQDDGGTPMEAHRPIMMAGSAIYRDNCSACHARDGRGVAGLFPALKGSPSVQSEKATSLMRVVLDGARSVSTKEAPTGPAMPSYAWQLDDGQVAAVLTYIRNSWGNIAPAVTSADVTHMRAELRKRPD